MAAALTAAVVLQLASNYSDWDANWVVWQVFDAGTGNGESSGRPDAFNPAGPYRGLLQVSDANAVRLGYTPIQMFDPRLNIEAGHRLWLERGTAPWPSARLYVAKPAANYSQNYSSEATMIAPDLTRLSPNVNTAPMPSTCRTVIIHATRSGTPMNPSEFEGTLNFMSRPGTTSSHWVISRTGIAARVVPDNQQAWHASEDNDNAWGIELEQGAEADGFTAPQIDKLVAVCKGYMADFGVPAVHVATSTTPGFIGHQETAQGKRDGKSDPGRLFPWDYFISRLTGPQTQQEADVAAEHYEGELNARRALVALMYNLTSTTQIRFSADGKGFEFINPADQTVIGKVPAIVVPEWAKPS